MINYKIMPPQKLLIKLHKNLYIMRIYNLVNYFSNFIFINHTQIFLPKKFFLGIIIAIISILLPNRLKL